MLSWKDFINASKMHRALLTISSCRLILTVIPSLEISVFEGKHKSLALVIPLQSCPTSQYPPVLPSAHPEPPVHTTVCWCPTEPPWWDCMHLGPESWFLSLNGSAHLGSWQIICFPFLLPIISHCSRLPPSTFSVLCYIPELPLTSSQSLLCFPVPLSVLFPQHPFPQDLTSPSLPSAPPVSPICPLPVSPHTFQSLPAHLSALFLQNSFPQDPKSPITSSAPPVSPSESQYPLSTTSTSQLPPPSSPISLPVTSPCFPVPPRVCFPSNQPHSKTQHLPVFSQHPQCLSVAPLITPHTSQSLPIPPSFPLPQYLFP